MSEFFLNGGTPQPFDVGLMVLQSLVFVRDGKAQGARTGSLRFYALWFFSYIGKESSPQLLLDAAAGWPPPPWLPPPWLLF